ncbi:MAG: dicarboxylate/amino acid:cation symporter [Candidatus Marinimicrobia bacterium]|nr:dicarboxylate/amino acid:cation symporter [Candidatus Neomarinimicrobiota bacterium]
MKDSTKSTRFIILIMLGMILGGVTGAIIGKEIPFIKLLGDLFLNALKMMIIPLIFSSMILGVTAIGDSRKLGRMGGFTILYYLLTTFLAVTTGIILVNIIKPGVGIAFKVTETVVDRSYSLLDVIRGMIPSNIIESMSNGDILPIIFFALFFGIVMNFVGEKAKPVNLFFEGVFEISLKMTHYIILFAPIGVFGLVASRLGSAGGWFAFKDELIGLGFYSVTVIAGLSIHSIISLPIILWIITKKSPIKFLKYMSDALLTAFSTASSSATLPLTMTCTENAGVSRSTSGFVLPLGATVNMDGTALYEAVAAIFIAQLYGIEITFIQQVIIVLTATLAAIGAAGIPQAGLVTMIIVLKTVGLPIEGIGAILAIDWFLDRIRTTVNVWGDSVGTVVIDKIMGNKN